jgi:hypothetical protein
LDNEPGNGTPCRKDPECREAAVEKVRVANDAVKKALEDFKASAAEELATNPNSELSRILRGGMPRGESLRRRT